MKGKVGGYKTNGGSRPLDGKGRERQVIQTGGGGGGRGVEEIGNFPVNITAGGISAGQLWIKVMHFL